MYKVYATTRSEPIIINQLKIMYRNSTRYLDLKHLFLVFYFFSFISFTYAQTLAVNGTVKDKEGRTLPGVGVTEKGKKNATTTDVDGKFEFTVAGRDAVLLFSSVGFSSLEQRVGENTTFNIILTESKNDLNEVVIVAYGEQKKESMVSSITSINPKELKGPTSNLTTMLAGRLSGVVAYQRSGEPGQDNAQFFIRGITSFGSGKVDPLILIDGMESTPTTLARLQPDDIAGFSILKDAAASSLYGARGANGVVLVTTKSGSEGKTSFNARFENSISSNTRNFQFADNITYMNLANEAVLTRDPLGVEPYSQSKIEHTMAGDDPILYPNNNWIDYLIKDNTMNQRFNMNMSGGGKVAQFYIAGTFNQDNGVLKDDPQSNFDNNIDLKSYEIRSNVNIRLTPTTEGIVRTSGRFDDYNGPTGGGADIFNQAIWSNPVQFPASYPASAISYAKHPLFGSSRVGNGDVLYNNPYANMVSGFQQYNTSLLNAQLEVKQDLKFLTPGLSARVMAYTQRYSYFDLSRKFNPFYYGAAINKSVTQGYSLNLLNENTATEYLNYNEGSKQQNTTTYLEAAVNFNKTYGEKHNVGGMLITILRNYLNANAGDLQSSLPFRNQGLSGRFTYAYDNRYLAELNFGYNGSERFAQNHRYGFFPSIGLGWNIANENFFKPLSRTIYKLKLRGTYGLVGNDQIGNPQDRFFYLSNVSLNDASKGATFGKDNGYTRPGVTVSRYENNSITWEEAQTANLGLDIGMFKNLNMSIDVYRQHRKSILMTRSYIPTTMGLSAPIQANVGEAEGKGVDLSLDYNKSIGKFWIQTRGTFTYASSKLLVNEEPNYTDELSYLYRAGNSLGQNYGLIAERLFVDDEEVKNSPVQSFGEVRGGDIKYKDVNKDGKITNLDIVPIGLPTTPELTYGFGFSMGYNGFDISTFFQGSGQTSFWINPYNISPFYLNGAYQNGLLKQVADSHWSEENRDLYAFWPRLSQGFNENNNQTSTWWMRNGSFLRLKTVELGYNFSPDLLKNIKIQSMRLYVNGNNLFAISSFKLWDPEMGGNGLGYPVQKVFNVGLNVQF